MSRLVVAIMAGLIAVGLTIAVFTRFVTRPIQREIAQLRQTHAHLSRQLQREQSLGADAGSRQTGAAPESVGRVAGLIQQVRERAIQADAARRATASEGAVPPADYRNLGQATARAALETFAWACDRGDTPTVARLIYFDGHSRDIVVAAMIKLPADLRAEWPTPEEFAAMMLTAGSLFRLMPGNDILQRAKEEPLTSGRVALTLPAGRRLGEFVQTDDGWKLVLSEELVAAAAQRLAPDAGAPSGGTPPTTD